MLERALMHVRAAMALRDCAADAASAGERRLLTEVARIHEARARAVMRSGSGGSVRRRLAGRA